MKNLRWLGSTKADLLSFPENVIDEVGHALMIAQRGGKNPNAKPLKGYGGASVLEIVENDDGNTYRAVYTVKYAEVVFVLHVFQKKSKSGIATPAKELEKVNQRLKIAAEEYATWLKSKR